MMEIKVLSTKSLSNAQFATDDAFVSIGYGLEVMLPKGVKSGDAWVLHLEPYKTPKHVTHTIQGRDLFISSDQQILSQIQGNLVLSPNDTKQTVNLPNQLPKPQLNHSSTMLVSFFNHLFLVKGRTLWWTDLDNVWEWQPNPSSEADFRIVEWESYDATGLVRSADLLYMHFPNAIYEITYVGKPTVVRIVAKVHGIGAITPRCLVVHNNIQFFIGSDNFYIWSVDTGLNAIGRDVWKKFLTVRGDVQDIWAYVDQRNNEICWVSETRIWAFNFLEKHWSTYSTDGIVAHATAAWHFSTPGITSTLEELPSTIVPVLPDGLENLWVTEEAICREQRPTDSLSKCLTMTQPFLETDDISYGDQHFVKRVDLLMIDARSQFPWVGLRVRVSGRDFVTHPSRWVDCGLWTQATKMKQIDFPAVAGKVLKFRFELVNSLAWNGLLPNGGLQLNGVLVDIANGQIIMDGSREDFLAQQFIFPDGTQTMGEISQGQKVGFFELNSWGERVDLPTQLAGPDK